MDLVVALTAQEEFWDATRDVVFLGPWCRRHSRRDAWKPLGDRMVPNPWALLSERRAAFERVRATCERLLPEIAAELDGVHALELGDRGWRILLWPWLVRYVAVLLDRSARLDAAREAYPAAAFVGLDERDFRVAGDTLGFVESLKSDVFNLQLFSSILSTTGASVECRRAVRREGVAPRSGPAGAARVMLEALGRRAPVRAKSTYLNRRAALCLQVSLRGAMTNDVAPLLRVPGAARTVSGPRTSLLAKAPQGADPLEELVRALLPGDLPRCFMEDMGLVKAHAKRWYGSRPRALWSCNSWYNDEAFKLWAAERGRAGALLLGTQHGGGYGCLEMHASEDHEVAIADRYYTWGWTSPAPIPVVPMPATKLIREVVRERHGTRILFAVTAEPRYLIEFPLVPELSLEQIRDQQQFASRLGAALRGRMTVRLHYEDMGWDFVERWADAFPDVTVEQAATRTFADSLSDCRVYVCDHVSTTFLEAMAADRPTILFWDPATYPLRAEAQASFDLLRTVGILHDGPDAAADHVALIYGDVDAWWRSAELQRVRADFCDVYARTAQAPVAAWASELRSVLRQTRREPTTRTSPPRSGDER